MNAKGTDQHGEGMQGKWTIFILKNPTVQWPVSQITLSKHPDGFLRLRQVNFISRVWCFADLDWGCIILISNMLWGKVGVVSPGPDVGTHWSAERCEESHLTSEPWRLNYTEHQLLLKRCSSYGKMFFPEHSCDGCWITLIKVIYGSYITALQHLFWNILDLHEYENINYIKQCD